jgi:dTDP-4-amino-4,6-dideoxygalactose transaminase
LAQKEFIKLPHITDGSTNNAHMFYIVCKNLKERTELIEYLKAHGVHAVFHYLSLHKSPFYELQHDGRVLPITDNFSETLLRLPMYYELNEKEIEYIVQLIMMFYNRD